MRYAYRLGSTTAREAETTQLSAAGWLDANWQYAGLVAACFYLATPLLFDIAWTLPALLLWLQLPIYVAHQMEEHVHDRFRQFVNAKLGHGLPVLTSRAVTVINVGGAWWVDLAVMTLARFGHPGAALLAFYLPVVNAVIHVVTAAVARRYNPGLISAVVLLLPFGTWGLVAYTNAYPVSVGDHVIGLLLVIIMHAAMVGHVMRRRTALRTR